MHVPPTIIQTPLPCLTRTACFDSYPVGATPASLISASINLDTNNHRAFQTNSWRFDRSCTTICIQYQSPSSFRSNGCCCISRFCSTKYRWV
mmetsp:Transcript_27107/g.56942  ORF Transcript_27107/g.56942 Transcript_27107/m.56942 type:complete len:92 (-) Transcript_27107:22-297(-)